MLSYQDLKKDLEQRGFRPGSLAAPHAKRLFAKLEALAKRDQLSGEPQRPDLDGGPTNQCSICCDHRRSKRGDHS